MTYLKHISIHYIVYPGYLNIYFCCFFIIHLFFTRFICIITYLVSCFTLTVILSYAIEGGINFENCKKVILRISTLTNY